MRTLSQVLADVFVHAPTNQNAGAAGGGGSSGGGSNRGQYHPLRRGQPTVEANRELFEESQRHVAASALTQAYCLACCMLALVLALTVCTVLVYAKGYAVYLSEKDKPCDQPLSRWLIVTLVAFPVRIALDVFRRCWHWASGEEGISRQISVIMTAWQMVGNPVLLSFGFWWLLHCKTCQKTSPELHGFVQLFYIYQVALWMGTLFVLFSLTSLLLWMQRNGLLDSGPGQHAAASPDVIHKIETIQFDPALFSGGQEDERQPPECCVCQAPFDATRTIKRTPCGHFFHEECLGTWLGKFAKSCPLCRTNLEDAVASQEV
uniref:RING-type domain-containing protein n=1 Tax=Pyrodinium bahamense TaxID=73915 RepID=A0A7S0F8F3_9DINO|mmetsp:Transcript_12060/g.33056  ORF Transcript_12060/g.33056 Transcript_12060/m.33056 type:complete len:319 (+) Transcript_12060:61-1017(+)